ncbi:MAG TPA: DUF4202 domain-containing protein [Sandaracinaceae bacterium LLY-WYZ-13_1]|nr:DUF4202 domain-containing protein [Sandaracinaceae bacterium LLY-WYZ-13_1]
MSERFEAALAAIDALHAEDPAREGGEPAELVYARRMSDALAKLVDEPSDALRLAVRAQHLQRWRIPRSDYPDGKAGYHRWRTVQKKTHGELAAAAVRDAGYDEPTAERVATLVRKKGLKADPEAQALEDAACLVFLEHGLGDFAEGRDAAQLVDILRKTWAKMSERGRTLALALPLDERARALVERALSPAHE